MTLFKITVQAPPVVPFNITQSIIQSTVAECFYYDGAQHYARVSDIAKEPLEMHMPIRRYDKMPLISFEDAVESLLSILPEIENYVAKQRCKSEPAGGLTKDVSASIILYSIEWEPHEENLYFALNSNLRAEDRRQLKPWFLCLKFILTALYLSWSQNRFKLTIFVWWRCSSCTATVEVLENEHFSGKKGS